MAKQPKHKGLDDRLEGKPVRARDFDAAMRQMLAAKPDTRSENREPTREELNRKFKLSRRS